MEKGTHVEDIYETAQRLHAAGIEVGFFLQFGYPGETREDIERTLQMVRDCQPDDIGMSVSYPLPGTRFFAAVQHELGSKQNWHDSEDLAMLYHGPFSTAFYRWLHRVLHREFRAQRAWADCSPRCADIRPCADALRLMPRSIAYAQLALPILRLELDRRARAPHKGLINLIPVRRALRTVMDVLLTHGYFLYEDPHELAVMKPYPPLGLLYISSHLKARGFASRPVRHHVLRARRRWRAYLRARKAAGRRHLQQPDDALAGAAGHRRGEGSSAAWSWSADPTRPTTWTNTSRAAPTSSPSAKAS